MTSRSSFSFTGAVFKAKKMMIGLGDAGRYYQSYHDASVKREVAKAVAKAAGLNMMRMYLDVASVLPWQVTRFKQHELDALEHTPLEENDDSAIEELFFDEFDTDDGEIEEKSRNQDSLEEDFVLC